CSEEDGLVGLGGFGEGDVDGRPLLPGPRRRGGVLLGAGAPVRARGLVVRPEDGGDHDGAPCDDVAVDVVEGGAAQLGGEAPVVAALPAGAAQAVLAGAQGGDLAVTRPAGPDVGAGRVEVGGHWSSSRLTVVSRSSTRRASCSRRRVRCSRWASTRAVAPR